MGIYGQDWASYQPAAPPTAGLSFAFTKVTEGVGYVNPKWSAQRTHAKTNGLVWGAYHYPHMGNSVQAEANYFLAQAAFAPGDLAVLDWEGYDKANSTVSAARQLAYKESWLRYVKTRLPHNPVGMYCNTDYWRNVDSTGYYGDFLWIATDGLPAGKPNITAPWLFHQYSAATVDKDYCHLASTAALRAWALSFAAPTKPPVPPIPVPVPHRKEITMIMVAVAQNEVPAGTEWPGIFLLADGRLNHVATPADETAFKTAGIPGPVTISWTQYQSLIAGN